METKAAPTYSLTYSRLDYTNSFYSRTASAQVMHLVGVDGNVECKQR